MKIKFKPHGLKAIQALFRTQRISIIHTPTQQGLINWKTMQPITPGTATVDALMYAPLRGWTLFPIALCRDQMGRRYIQFETVKVPDIYSSSQLGGIDERYLIEQPDGRRVSVIDFHVERFRASCNPQHVVDMAWLLVPNLVDIDERHMDALLDAVGAWGEKEAA